MSCGNHHDVPCVEIQPLIVLFIDHEISDAHQLNIVEIPGENLGRKFGYSKMKIIKNIFNTLKTIFLIKIN